MVVSKGHMSNSISAKSCEWSEWVSDILSPAMYTFEFMCAFMWLNPDCSHYITCGDCSVVCYKPWNLLHVHTLKTNYIHHHMLSPAGSQLWRQSWNQPNAAICYMYKHVLGTPTCTQIHSWLCYMNIAHVKWTKWMQLILAYMYWSRLDALGTLSGVEFILDYLRLRL